jgi:hypothetical protein
MKTNSHRIRSALARLGSVVLASGGLAVLSAPHPAAAAETFFAAPDGSGSTCSQASPCSLTGARDKVRSSVSGMNGDIVVNLRGGTYRLTEPLTLGPQDSGTGGHKVIWQAQPGEKPVLSGGTKITGWQSHDAQKRIYRAPVAAGTKSRQLFVNGVRAVRARSALDPTGFTLTPTGFTSTDPAYRTWGNPTGIELVGRDSWRHHRCPVSSITASGSGSALTMAQPCFGNGGRPPSPANHFPDNGGGETGLFDAMNWIENANELLDTPGEFYLDSGAGQVYYIPRDGENLSSATVELPTTQSLISLTGTPGHLRPVNDDSGVDYAGGWQTSTGRPFGDFRDDVHYTTTNGDSATITFTGTGIDVLSETNSDEGDIDVYVDGALDRTVSGNRTGGRLAQQAIYSKTGLPQGQHTVKLVKRSGSFMVIDGYVPVTAPIAPIHDIALRGITFANTTWVAPNGPDGYRGNQGGIYWTGTPIVTSRIAAAVTVTRGQRIDISGNEFTHLGGSALDLAAGTQDSTVVGNRINDVAGIGVNVGEYDDHWLTDPARMTSGNTVGNNAISYIGQDFDDAIAIIVGYSRKVTVSHNDISHVPYSGISVGWGWGWDSPYGSSRRGTNYARDNHVIGNRVNDVMRVLNDGGFIYTLGGQGDGSVKSTIKGNAFSIGTGGESRARGLYLDEGSSWWDASNNVIAQTAENWAQMWTGSIHDMTIHDNYSDVTDYLNDGTNVSLTNTTYVTNGVWPAGAKTIVAAAGLESAYKHLLLPDPNWGNDGSTGDLLAPAKIAYNGAWQVSKLRSPTDGSLVPGDLNADVHHTQTNGNSVTFTFTGTGLRVLGELSADQGDLAVTLDGASAGTVNTSTTGAKKYQQTIYQVRNLPYGNHSVTLTKQSGTWATIDGYLLDRSLNDTDPALTYTGAWYTSGNRGFGDYQNDVHYSNTNGDSVTATWNGTGIDVLTEKYSDQGDVDIYIDGQFRTTVDTTNPTRQTQQLIYRIDNLPEGPHTIRLVKKSGNFFVIDHFTIR